MADRRLNGGPTFDRMNQAMSRRRVLKLFGALASAPIAASLLAACGSSSSSSKASSSSSASGQSTQTGSGATAVSGIGTPMNTFQNSSTPQGSTPQANASTSSSSTSGQPKQGGTIHQSIINNPDTLDPALASSAVSSSIFQYIFDSLVYIGDDHQTHPWMAEKWDISPDGKQITMTIRTGIKFHDGTACDGAAVKANFDRILDPKVASITKASMGSLTTVDLVDPQTVRFNFASAYAPFFTNLDGTGISSPAAIQKWGQAYGHHPVGTGPFMFKSWVLGQSVSLVRNPNYVNYRADYKNKGAPYVDGLNWQLIGEAATSTAALESGELDIGSIDLTQASKFQNDPKYQVFIWKSRDSFIFIEYNKNKFPFNDLAFRKAVAYAMNREAMVQSAYNGYATVNLLPLPGGVAGWDPSLDQYGYPYNMDKAKQTLADAGYKAGSDGILAEDGKKLSFTMLVYTGNDPLKVDADIVQQSLKQLGMDCKLNMMDFAAELPLLNAANFDCDIMRWTSPDPNILSLMFKGGGWTHTQPDDKQLDALCATADGTLDPAKRIDAVHEVVKYVLQQAIVAPICTDWGLWAAHTYVKDYSLTVFGTARLADVWIDKSA
ncbi:MAG TPA: ABC transporter substrate-binding protein [Thermomicrobiaceae bacterium]|nr:ABC transporter substrate-binding protein [Thermomicrobiaceae bacterium]